MGAPPVKHVNFDAQKGPTEASLLAHACSKNPGPLIFQDFDPPEASLRAHACSKNPGRIIFQDFEPPEASSCMLKKYRSAILGEKKAPAGTYSVAHGFLMCSKI